MKRSFIFAALAAGCMIVACNPEATKPDQGPEGEQNQEETYEMLYTTLVKSPTSEQMFFQAEGASPNHKFMAGNNMMTFNLAIWEVEKGVTEFPIENLRQGALHAVSNSGIAVGDYVLDIYDHDDPEWGPIYRSEYHACMIKDGNIIELAKPAIEELGGISAYCISEDESVIGGFYYGMDYHAIPCVWLDNGTRIVDLPQPQGDYDYSEVRYMNLDGSVLGGFASEASFGEWVPVFWKGSNGNYEICLTAKELGWDMNGAGDFMDCLSTTFPVSANGEWSAVFIGGNHEVDDWDTWDIDESTEQTFQLARINIAKKTIELGPVSVAGEPDPNSWFPPMAPNFEPVAVANDGTVVYYSGLPLGGLKTAYVWRPGEEPKLLSEFPGADQIASYASVVPCWIAGNCSAIAGYAESELGEVTSFILY